jgi:hypothetical protein
MSYLRYLSLCSCGGVQHKLCCVFFFVFLRRVYPRLAVSLDCPFLMIALRYSLMFTASAYVIP